MKIAEAEGIMDAKDMHDFKEKLQTFNEELSQVKDNHHQLEKQLKSTEVSVHQIILKTYNTDLNIMR